ncbi:MAG: tRNA (adenosine(37)-N6)-threonylcarbamoyltransferase complex dimerization subunit type 1 TsaB [Acidobacteriota bacterium]
MILLALDTSGPDGSVALARDGVVCEGVEIHSSLDFAKSVLPVIDGLLTRHGLLLAEMDGFAAVTGPGSFTGLRVGLATIQALARCARKQAAGFTAIEVLAAAYREHADHLAVWIDVGRGEVYAADCNGLDLFAISAPRLDRPERLLSGLEAGTLIVGSGARRNAELIERQGSLRVDTSVRNLAAVVCDLARAHPERFADPDRLDAVYVRAATEKPKSV